MVPASLNRPRLPMARVAFRASIASALACVVAAAISATDLARAQDGDRSPGLLDRIFSGSERFSGGGGGEYATAPAAHDRAAQASGPDLLVRLDRLEAQIRQLTGVIEQLQYRNQQLEAHVRRMQDDTDYRLQELGSKGAPRPAGCVRGARRPPPRRAARPRSR